MTQIFHRDLRATPPLCVRGGGAYLEDAEGKQYLDASGGAAVSLLGHGHAGVVAAVRAQAEALAYAYTAFFSNAPSEELAARLVAHAPLGLTHVYFVSGGSEANETALKLARAFHLARGGGKAQRNTAPGAELSRRDTCHAGGERQSGAARAL